MMNMRDEICTLVNELTQLVKTEVRDSLAQQVMEDKLYRIRDLVTAQAEKEAKVEEEKKEEIKTSFIEYLGVIIDYWETLPDKSLHERMTGVVFSLLVALDGEAGDQPPFAVRPIDEKGNEGPDISGSLHECFGQASRKGEINGTSETSSL
jgi:hypothetical protein